MCRLPGAISWPSLAAWKLTVAVALHAVALDLAGGGIDPGGDVGGDHRGAAGVDRLDRGGRRLARRAREAGAEDRVDHRPRPRRAPPAPRPRRPRAPDRRSGRGSPRRRRRARRPATAAAPRPRDPVRSRRAATSPSPPLLPLPQTTRIGPSGRAARPPRRAPGRRPPSAPATGTPLLLDRPGVGRPHRVGVEQRIEPALHRRSVPSRCAPGLRRLATDDGRGQLTRVRERDRERMPSRSAIAAASPLRARRGGRSPPPTTSISCMRMPPRPSAFIAASLAANRAARWRPGRARRAANSSSSRDEQARGQARAPLERALEALDLDQVDAESGGRSPPQRYCGESETVSLLSAKPVGVAAAGDEGRERGRRAAPRRRNRCHCPRSARRPRRTPGRTGSATGEKSEPSAETAAWKSGSSPSVWAG